MARKSYRRRYRKSGKWSSNISTILDQYSTVSAGEFKIPIVLAKNSSTNSSSTITQTYTVKNFELTALCEITNSNTDVFENMVVYIMYLPEVLDPNNLPTNFPQLHPEYVMTYKYIGSPHLDSTQNFQPIRVKSRLARKLNSGDRVIAFFQGYRTGTSTSAMPINISGLVRYWTKAN